MINVSREFKEAMKTRTDFTETATITFSDGQTLSLTQHDFTLSGNGITDGAGSSSFPLGAVVEKAIHMELMNADDHLSSYSFQGAVIRLQLHFALESRTESIDYGTYTVVTPETYGSTVQIEAVDELYKADVAFSTRYSFPARLGDIVREACTTLGITLATPTFPHDDFEVQQKPEDLTYREFFAMAAMIAGGYARMNYAGQLEIKAFDFSLFEQGDRLNGGIFDANSPYASGDTADGGRFAPWDTGYQADSGTFAGMEGSHVFYNFSTLTVETDDVVITGVQCEDADGNVLLAGKEGYVLSIENSLLAGQEQAALDIIGQAVIGARFRPFSGSHIAYPLAEFGDPGYLIDRKGNVYQTILTDIDFSFFGMTELSCAADSPLRNSSTYASNLTKAVVAARKNTQKQISAYDLEVQRFASMAANSMGLYETKEEQPDGSIIYYQHDKPTIAESEIIWKNTAEAFLVSNDGGKTWRGMDANGNVLATVLNVIGINAEWIRTGIIKSKEGNTYFDLSSGDLVAEYNGSQVKLRSKGSSALLLIKEDTEVGSFFITTSGKSQINTNTIILGAYNDPKNKYFASLHDDGTTSLEVGEIAVIDSSNENTTFRVVDGNIYVFDKDTGNQTFRVFNTGTILGYENIKIVDKSGNQTFFLDNSGDMFITGIINGKKNAWIEQSTGMWKFAVQDNQYSGSVQILKEQSGQSRVICRGHGNNTAYLGSATYRWNTVFCGSVDQSSDRKLKTDIGPIDKATEFLMDLEPVQYRMKDGGKRIHYGFIAQDVAKAAAGHAMGDLSMYKAAVIDGEKEAYYDPNVPDEQLSWGLDYSQIIAPLVQVVQEQQKRLDALETRLASLEKQMGKEV